MKMIKKVSVQGEFAKIGTDIRDQDEITILDEGTEITGTYGEQTVFQIKTGTGKDMVVSFNQTSINNLVDAYGDDSQNWTGKRVKAWVVKQMVGDGLKNVA